MKKNKAIGSCVPMALGMFRSIRITGVSLNNTKARIELLEAKIFGCSLGGNRSFTTYYGLSITLYRNLSQKIVGKNRCIRL
eukprot:snap_masked-scaffold_20-processed-gene-2.35-mRNA-1 protein AED:1.00 eAED:1.00 QI:0/0/0/0/1/1/2/0/80